MGSQTLGQTMGLSLMERFGGKSIETWRRANYISKGTNVVKKEEGKEEQDSIHFKMMAM